MPRSPPAVSSYLMAGKMKSECALCTSVPLLFFFQAEDGIRDIGVTGVQTCALPIYRELCLPKDVAQGGSGNVSGPVVGNGVAAARVGAVHQQMMAAGTALDDERSEERRVGKSVDLGGRRIIKKKRTVEYEISVRSLQ